MGNFFVQFTTLSKSVYLHAQRSRYEARCKVLEFILSHCVLLWLRHVELRQMNLWMFPPGECSPFLFLLTLDSSYGYTYFITNQIWNKVSTCLNLFYWRVYHLLVYSSPSSAVVNFWYLKIRHLADYQIICSKTKWFSWLNKSSSLDPSWHNLQCLFRSGSGNELMCIIPFFYVQGTSTWRTLSERRSQYNL